ncbi:MAG: enolase C-terminal domain-like protein [Gemmatimonadota bacterium]
MKITDLQFHPGAGLLRLVTDDGPEGWCFGVGADTARTIDAAFRDVLVGADPLDRERLWHEGLRLDRYRYLAHGVRGLVDVALWDLAGKVADLPVYRLAGGYRDRLPCYMSGPHHDTVEAYAEEAVRGRSLGFAGYKDHCRLGPDGMVQVARACREAVGPDFPLMHDAVAQYLLTDALRVGRVLDEVGYYWFEEPLRDCDLRGLRQLCDALDLPVAATEYLPGTIHATAQVLAQGAADIVRASVPWRGGITDMLKIARLAESFDVACEITSVGVGFGFVHAHVIGALRNCTFFEGWKPGSLGGEPFVANPLHVVDGHLQVPAGPGLGMELDWDAIRRADS